MEILSFTGCVAILAVLAVLDFIYCNIILKNYGATRWPFLRDLPTVVAKFHCFHDYAVELFNKNNTRVIELKLAWYNVIGITDPKDVEHMLKTNWKNYQVSTGLRGEAMTEVFGDGIFRADGDHWFLQRKHASREFSANIFRNHMTQEFIFYTQQLIEVLGNIADNKQGSNRVDMHQQFYRLTLDSFGKVAFGVDLGGLRGDPVPFAVAFDTAQEITAKRIATKIPHQWQLERLLGLGSEKILKDSLQTINDFVQDLCNQRLSSPRKTERNDLLTKLIRVAEAGSEDELANSTAYLRDMTVNFIIAGRDTTACALSWLTYELCKHPQVEAKLQEELGSIIGDRIPSFDDFAETHYLTACISETLRLHPSVPFDVKSAAAPDVLPSNGTRIQKGDNLAYVPYAMGRMEWLWGPDACEFRPQRWLDANGVFRREEQCKFTAFQAGPRVCLGVDMAMLEMKVVAAMLLSKFTFDLKQEPKYHTGLVLQMDADGLQVDVKRR